ncbi:ABC transporter ATP-binding protein [Oceaniglobus trochenteri]|uniref:ABC transporter ATP-binding protein n=1 Tax=Oceaniglobus trochenteri TaxID=2763260 RepID=UPI001CFFA537|nr:ABC transporter ATP-binding protein [Oceaniglobus trochenteri]
MAKLNLNQLSKSFGPVEVLKPMDLEITDGEFAVFVGPSGCGKSTLLRTIAGLEESSGGDILIDGARVNDTDSSERGLSMVFQNYALYPHMTIFENMAFGLRIAKTPKDEVTRRVNKAAAILKIEHMLDRYPKTLSGGQRQRVAIGRSIVRDPKIFLFDEPLSNLDAELRVQMRIEIARLHETLGATMIYVTHDQVEAMTLADKIVVLKDGRIEQVGSPLDLYNAPANRFVAGFIGSPGMNFLDGTVEGAGNGQCCVALACGGHVALPLRDAPAVGAPVTIGVRPEHVSLGGAADEGVAATVLLTEQLGDETHVHLSVKGSEGAIVAQVRGQVKLRSGTGVTMMIAPEGCHLFDETGLARRDPAAAQPEIAAAS